MNMKYEVNMIVVGYLGVQRTLKSQSIGAGFESSSDVDMKE